ncbi:MAG: Stage III sporulation protein J [Parcubacteria group bacterium GW2011_GWA2_51_10]|nr:MAG: Stage III sporulation protein J [Parcubacteria group bacterium GW2011_GWA2_51_10]
MFSSLFHTVVYNPLYNGLVFLIDILPAHDVGLAVILLTIVVRIILFPLSRKAVKAQEEMRKISPQIDALKEKYKNDREQLGRAIFALYREHDIHPFASFFLILIQLPILFALYWIFALGGLPEVNSSLLYPLVSAPPSTSMEFLGLIDMGGKSIVLAVLAALTQIVYTRLSMGERKKQPLAGGTFGADMAKSFDIQMRYVLPLIVGGVAYTVPAAAPLYWVTSNLFMIGQELAGGRRFRPEK